MQLRGVVLVEGTSDRSAVETLARRRGRDLQAEGVAIVPMGGYGNLPLLLGRYRDVRLAGLYDVGEERHFLRALGRADRGELERAGFFACTRDLEDELTRAVGPEGRRACSRSKGSYARSGRTRSSPRTAPGRSKNSCTASCGTASRVRGAPRRGPRARARPATARPCPGAVLGSGARPTANPCKASVMVLPCGAWHRALRDERSCFAVCSTCACSP